MNWSKLRRMAISLPIAILATFTLITISEYGYKQTANYLRDLSQAQQKRNTFSEIHEQVLRAESALRAYALTKDESHLPVYRNAQTTITKKVPEAYAQLEHSPDLLAIFAPMAHNLSRKTAEMDLSLRLSHEDRGSTIQSLLLSPEGLREMESIYAQAQYLSQYTASQANQARNDLATVMLLQRIALASIAILGIAAFYFYLLKNKKVDRLHDREHALLAEERSRLESLVRDRTATLTELATHLQQVREDERGHLARELHDELGALLTAAKLDVARLKSRIDMGNPEVTDRIKHLTETLNSGIALKRRIVEDLRPSSLSNLGLSTALEILSSEFAQRSGLEVNAILEPVELSDSTELTIYRLVQESLTNIGKYAKASRVDITVHRYPTYVAIQIQDNGQGFDMKAVRSNSHGLTGMRHRVEAAGGKLTINTSPGQGTSVSAVMPITAVVKETPPITTDIAQPYNTAVSIGESTSIS